ncbi:MAG: polyprenyl synthetase family protein [Mogibacterium sp.]|nr:polyprenyl synthetase family protein [Mogibacterium sp.]
MLKFDDYKKMINDHLTDYIPATGEYAAVLRESMEYSLKVGGKRLRPVLLLASCDLAGGDIEMALPYAASLEYIHTYSLIHDDLPAMDNDDLRRGKPTNHKVYGDDIAILAGDGLLNTAAQVMTGEVIRYAGDADVMLRHARAAHEIMSRAGICGMIGGQTADVKGEYQQATAELVAFIEDHKTADLITAPVRAGLMLAGADEETLTLMTSYAHDIGVAFQILDDILDFEGDAELIGKNVGKDQDLGKCNYVCVHGMDAAREELHRLTSSAKQAAGKCGPDAEFFIKLADQLEVRQS